MTAPLVPQKLVFIQEYLLDLNATRAAIAAGYSKQSAKRTGYRLTHDPAIAAAIQEAMNKRSTKLGISAEMVLGNLQRMANYDVRDAVEWTADTVTLKNSAEIGDDIAFCITEIKQTKDGVAIKFADKQQANVNIGRHLKLFTDVQEHKGIDQLAERMADIARRRGK